MAIGVQRGASFEEIRTYLDTIPIIETHEHHVGTAAANPEFDVLGFLSWDGYFASDLQSASFDFATKPDRPGSFTRGGLDAIINDRALPFADRFAAYETGLRRTAHTGYGKAHRAALALSWDLETLSAEGLLAVQERMRRERDQAFCDRLYREHRIAAMIVNVNLVEVMAGRLPYNPTVCRFVLDLPQYHGLFGEEDIRKPHLEERLKRKIVVLDDYLEAFSLFLQDAMDFGIVGIKDQTAYRRGMAYEHVDRARAEAVFNRLISHPRDTFGTEETRPLDDFLFHHIMRLASTHDLPVQLHTGHMAGIRNDIQKTNPALLTSVMELHQGTRFDLFHGGWPYLGEYLYLGKNYPNCHLDMCWCNAIDPLYAVEFFQRALATVPHTKVNGFGGDTGAVEFQIAYLQQAKDNLASGLAGMVDEGWLDTEAACAVGKAWLFDNPNALFKLGLESAP